MMSSPFSLYLFLCKIRQALQIDKSTESAYLFNTLKPRQNGRFFQDDIFKHIFLNENIEDFIDICFQGSN